MKQEQIMKTYPNNFRGILAVVIFLMSFQQSILAGNPRDEWKEIVNIYASAKLITTQNISVSLLAELASGAEISLQHDSGILMFVSTVSDIDDFDQNEDLIAELQGFNGDHLRPVREKYVLDDLNSVGVTLGGSIGGVRVLADRVFVTLENGYLVHILTIRKDGLGLLELPNAVRSWIGSYCSTNASVLARCGID